MPGKEKHNNLEQLQNTCPKSTTRSFLEAPASPHCSSAGCPGQEVRCVLSALLSSFQDPRPAQERAGTFLCWAEHSSVLSSGTALPRSLPATSGWNQRSWGWQEGPAELVAAARAVAGAEGTVLAWQPHLPAWLLHARGCFRSPCSGRSSQAAYPELCRACFPPSLPLWPLEQFGILVLFSFPETGGKLEAG